MANRTGRLLRQIVEYLSALTAMTVDELDEEVDGRLETALRCFDDEADEDGFERRWKAAGANLRAGLARIIVAVDDSANDLRRIVRFLSEHSNLDIRLVEVAKFVEAGVGTVYVPAVVVNEGRSSNGIRERPVPCDVFLSAWKSASGPGVAGAWDELVQELATAGIEGLQIGCYSSGIPRLDMHSSEGPVGLMRLADPKVSTAELRDLLHKGRVWKEHLAAASAREAFRARILELVPGAKIAGGAGRVYAPVEGLGGRSADVVEAIAKLAAAIA